MAELLATGGLRAREIEVIGVGLGPGSYTGLRVGVTAAKTLAYVTGAALVGLDSLEAVAWNAPGTALRVSVVADAQRGDVYSAEFMRQRTGRAAGLYPREPDRTAPGRARPARARNARPGSGARFSGDPRKVPPEFLAGDDETELPEWRNVDRVRRARMRRRPSRERLASRAAILA